jgi:uridine kinase
VKKKHIVAIYILFFLIRFLLIIIFYPEMQSSLFIPFINNAAQTNNLDIWQSWISLNGRPDAFPYGIGMALPLVTPIYFISKLMSMSVIITQLIFGCTLLLIDTLALRLIIVVTKNIKSVLLYAFSPLAIYISYFHGQLDLIPSILFLSFLVTMKSRKMLLSGVLLAITISAKLSFTLVLPFLLIFYLKNPRNRNSIRKMVLGFMVSFPALQFPIIFSNGYQKMILETPEANRIFYYTINLASTSTILIFPTIYAGLLLWLWRTGRTTVDVLISFFASSLIAIGIFAPGAIGWLFWGIPLMALIASRKSWNFFIMTFIFQILAILTYADQQNGANSKIWEIDFSSFLERKSPLAQSLLETAFFCLGILIIMSILRTALASGDIYGLNSKPISIAIAGDSGVGKDTLTNNLSDIFGPLATSIIYGDNYHKFERDSLKWKTYTHLNPEANEIKLLIADVHKSIKREPIWRRSYDHSTGRFTNPTQTKPTDFLILNGLHSLSLGKSQQLIDLNIFLSMSEKLRIKLKHQRDSQNRNVSKEYIANQILTRSEDAKKFIDDQAKKADIIFNITEINSDLDQLSDVELKVETRDLNFLNDLSHHLRVYSDCDIEFQVETTHIQKLTLTSLNVESDILDAILNFMVPEKNQVFFENYKLNQGLQGIMTLITILGLVEKRLGPREVIYD